MDECDTSLSPLEIKVLDCRNAKALLSAGGERKKTSLYIGREREMKRAR